jgi:hypothetical protein
MLDTNFREFPF